MRIIAGKARNRKIIAPAGTNTRPTLDRVRENLFNILQSRIPDSIVLDLFAGSGALSFEAISRGAAHAVLCDHDRNANRIERINAASLGFEEQSDILYCDWKTAIRALADKKMTFDVVFLDPPYKMTDLLDVFKQLKPLLDADSLIIVEHEAKRSIDAGEGYVRTDERKWGFCGVSFFRKKTESH